MIVTVHPSSILRAPREDFDDAYAALVRDLKLIARPLEAHPTPAAIDAWQQVEAPASQ